MNPLLIIIAVIAIILLVIYNRITGRKAARR